jgi:hypothetical protein
VALGSVGVAPGEVSGAVGVAGLMGADVARRIVGAGAVDAPEGRSGIVGAGRGAPPGTGGRTGGASGTVEDGTAGASAAFKVTRTVSFFSGTLDVCLEGVGGWFSFSLMRAAGFWIRNGASKATWPWAVKRGFSRIFRGSFSRHGILLAQA